MKKHKKHEKCSLNSNFGSDDTRFRKRGTWAGVFILTEKSTNKNLNCTLRIVHDKTKDIEHAKHDLQKINRPSHPAYAERPRTRMAKGSQSSIFDRLSKTETYASKRLKEKRQTVKDGGRPLFQIELDSQPSTSSDDIPAIKSSDSGGSKMSRSTNLTCMSSASSVASGKSFRTARSTTSTRQGSIFDRLYKTGTSSSLRKHKKSDTYDDTKDKAFHAQDLLRDYGKGSTRIAIDKV